MSFPVTAVNVSPLKEPSVKSAEFSDDVVGYAPPIITWGVLNAELNEITNP